MERGAREHGLCITASVFRWLCDVGAIALDGGVGSEAGGFVLTDKEQESIACGACLIEGVSSKNPAAIRGADGRLPSPEYSSSPAARLNNWTHLLRCIARLSGTDVDENEKVLVVAQDVAVISCVLHRLAALTALSATVVPRPLSHDILPRNLFGHKAITVLAAAGAKHFRFDAQQLERLITMENEKFTFLVFRNAEDSSGPRANEVALGAWLEELNEHHYRIVDALREDNRAIRFLLLTLAQGLHSRWKHTVAMTARVLGAIAADIWGEAVWLWLVGGPLGQDGLSTIVSALHQQPDPQARQALAELLVGAARTEHVAHVLALELPLRVSGPGAYSQTLAELLELIGSDEKAKQELEWHGVVPLLVNQALCDGRVGAAGDGGERKAALELVGVTFRLFSRCLVGSAQLVDGVLSMHEPRSWAGQPPAVRAEGFMAGCRLLTVMVEQRCAVAGRLYRLLIGEWETSYGDALARERMEEGLSLVLSHSTTIPLRLLVRPLPALVKQHRATPSDIAFWVLLSRHAALEPQDCMLLIALLSSVALTSATSALDAGSALVRVVSSRMRHGSVVVSLELEALPPDVEYRERDDALVLAGMHCQALEEVLRRMLSEESVRAMVEAWVREAAGSLETEDEREIAAEVLARVLSGGASLPPVRGAGTPRNELPRVPSGRGSARRGGEDAVTERAEGAGLEEEGGGGMGQRVGGDEGDEGEGGQGGREEAGGDGEGEGVRREGGSAPSSKSGGRYSELSQRRREAQRMREAVPAGRRGGQSGGAGGGAEREEREGGRAGVDIASERDGRGGDVVGGQGGAEGGGEPPAKLAPGHAKAAGRERGRPPAGPGAGGQGSGGGGRRRGSVKGYEGSMKVVQEALRARGFGSAEEVFVWIDVEEKGRVAQLEADKQLKPLRLAQPATIELHRGMRWSARPERPVALAEWVQVLGWGEGEEGDGEERAAAARQRRRETAGAVRRLMAEAERLFRRKLAADLEEALRRVAAHRDAPPPALPARPAARPAGVGAGRARMAVPAQQQGPKLTPPNQAGRPRRQKRPRDRRLNISDLGGTMVAPPPAEKPLTSMEKSVLEAFVRSNPLASTEPDADDTWLLASQRQYRLLPRQLIRLGQLDKACKVLCNLHFLQEAIKELGAYFVMDQLQALWKALHQGQGRDHVDDYLDFVEHNAEAISEDPSRIFDLARQEPEVSQVYKDAMKAIVVGDTTVRQAQARVLRLEGSSATPLAKAVAYCRTQRSIARLMGRGITGCFSKQQLEKYKKALQFVAACAQSAQDTLQQQPLESYAGGIHSLLTSVGQDEPLGRAHAFFDVMDALTPILPDAMPGLPEPHSPRRDAVDIQRESREEIENILGSARHVRLFLSAAGEDQGGERRFLTQFVLPGLRVQCSAHGLDLGWCDPGVWPRLQRGDADAGVLERRLRLLDQCYIHSQPLDPNDDGVKQRVPFALLLLSLRFREPVLREAELRRQTKVLEEYPRVVCAEGGQLGVCDAEVQHAFLSRSDPRSFVFLTEAEYLADEGFLREVPEPVRMPLLEASTAETTVALKDQIRSKASELGEEEVDGIPRWRVVDYPTNYSGLSKDVRSSQGDSSMAVGGIRLGGVELLGVQVFQRLWGLMKRTYPRPPALDGLEREEAEQEASRFLVSKQTVLLPCREMIVEKALDFVRDALPDPVPRGTVLSLAGPHGIGLTALLAGIADRLMELEHLHVIYYQQQPWHSPSHLVWFLCSQLSDRTVGRPSWKAFIELCCSPRPEYEATVLVLDALSSKQQEEVAEALARAGRRGAPVAVVMGGTGADAAAPAPNRGGIASKCTELEVPPLTPESVGILVEHVLGTLGPERRMGEQHVAALCSKTTTALESLASAGGTGALAAGLPLLVYLTCLVALEGGAGALETLRADVEGQWHDNVLPYLERRHGAEAVRWAMLALHYEPSGLRVSQLCHEGGEKRDARGEMLPLDEASCNVGPRGAALAKDLEAVLGRGQGPFGQVLVMQRVSLKAAVELRYLEHWRRVEEEAAGGLGRGGGGGVLAPPLRRLPTLQSVMARTPSSFKLIGMPRDPSPTKLSSADRSPDGGAGKKGKGHQSKPASAARKRLLSAKAQGGAGAESGAPSPDKPRPGEELSGDPVAAAPEEAGVRVTSFVSDLEGSFQRLADVVEVSKVLSWGSGADSEARGSRLELAEGAAFVCGGGCVDQGGGDLRLLRLLVDLHDRHPDRVTLLVGPHETHKLRLLSELSEECLADPEVLSDTAFPYWLPDEKTVTPKMFLEREGLEDSPVSRLKWMLAETMGAGSAFELRRQELAAEKSAEGGEAVSDEAVLQSFLHSVTPGHGDAVLLQYLQRAKLVHVAGTTLLLHGALRSDNVGVVPGEKQRAGGLRAWVDALNAWCAAQIEAYEQAPSAGKNSMSRAASLLIDLGVAAGGSVVNGWWPDAGQTVHLEPEVKQFLSESNVTAVVCGHVPQGGCPTVIRDEGLSVVCAHAWSADGGEEAGERAVSEVLVHGDGRIECRGRMRGGRGIGFSVGGGQGASGDDALVGRRLKDGRVVRARLSGAGGEYVVGAWDGGAFADAMLGKAELEAEFGVQGDAGGLELKADASVEEEGGGGGGEEAAAQAPSGEEGEGETAGGEEDEAAAGEGGAEQEEGGQRAEGEEGGGKGGGEQEGSADGGGGEGGGGGIATDEGAEEAEGAAGEEAEEGGAASAEAAGEEGATQGEEGDAGGSGDGRALSGGAEEAEGGGEGEGAQDGGEEAGS